MGALARKHDAVVDGDAGQLVGEAAAATRGAFVHVAGADARDGQAVWQETGPRRGVLGFVGVDDKRVSVNNTRRLFYELALSCAREAWQRGVRVGTFRLIDARLVNMLTRDFKVEPVVVGRAERGGAAEWEFEVELADAIAQLEGALRG